MPSNGMTKIDAVNMVLSGINEYRVSSLDTNGASIQADAERYVDDSTRYFCSMGWPCNTRRSAGFTPAAVTFEVELPAGPSPFPVLRIRAAGPDQHRNLVIRGGKVYDADKGTFSMGSQSPVYLDVAELLPFDDLDPMLKELVAKHAQQQFARRFSSSQLADAFISQELGIVDSINPREGTFVARPLFVQEARQPQQG